MISKTDFLFEYFPIDLFIGSPYNLFMRIEARSLIKTILRLLIGCSAVLLSAGCSYRPLFSTSDISSAVIISETRRTIEITPSSPAASTTGLLFYPGGLVDSHVYNELLSGFVEAAGITTIIVKMPSNLAVLDIDAGLSVTTEYPKITRWIIAGHSLGGSMAASTVKGHESAYAGLIFMDSYPADGDSLKTWPGAVLSLYSSAEKVSDPERMQQTLDLIPAATWLTAASRVYPPETENYAVIHQIDGGSHSFFGTYGPQDGDYIPTITRSVFHAEVIDYMVEFFTENGWS